MGKRIKMLRPRVGVMKPKRSAAQRSGTNSVVGKSGSRWQKIRREYLRLHPECEVCLRIGVHRAADVVDHVRPRTHGGSDATSNLQSLCHDCHDAKSALEAQPDYVPPDEPTAPKPEPPYTIA